MRRHPPEDPDDDAGPLFGDAARRAWERSEVGANRAAGKADRVEPGWKHDALAALFAYAKLHDVFLMEDARAEIGTPGDADPRAWGHIARKAEKLGYIRADGFEVARKSNCCAKVRWKSLVFTITPPPAASEETK